MVSLAAGLGLYPLMRCLFRLMSLLLAHHMMILIKVVSFDPLSTFALVCYPMSLLLAPKWVPLLVGLFL